MWKSIATRFFIVFSLLFILQSGLLSYYFFRVIRRETEATLIDSLSRQSQYEALRASLEQKSDSSLLSSEGVWRQYPVDSFDPQRLAALIAAKQGQSIVSECFDKSAQSYYCALSFIEPLKAWHFSFVPKASHTGLLKRFRLELLSAALFSILAALALTFLVSRRLFQPLIRFVSATQRIAEGRFDKLELPTQSSSEIGDLARSFQMMAEQIRIRENHLSQSALKLAHAERLASIGQMGASIAHEVKNPLMAMIGYAQILAEKSVDPQSREAAEIIRKEADRCSAILTQMLRFSRHDPQENKIFSLKEVVDSTALLAKAEAKRLRVILEIEIRASPIVRGNSQQIQQILLNLLMNAFQASQASDNKKVILTLSEEGSFAHVSVEDFGPGISHDLRFKIFEPFFTTKQKGEGTGLGLSVALEIAEQHGGSLEYIPKPAQGSIFHLRLPSLGS